MKVVVLCLLLVALATAVFAFDGEELLEKFEQKDASHVEEERKPVRTHEQVVELCHFREYYKPEWPDPDGSFTEQFVEHIINVTLIIIDRTLHILYDTWYGVRFCISAFPPFNVALAMFSHFLPERAWMVDWIFVVPKGDLANNARIVCFLSRFPSYLITVILLLRISAFSTAISLWQRFFDIMGKIIEKTLNFIFFILFLCMKAIILVPNYILDMHIAVSRLFRETRDNDVPQPVEEKRKDE